MENYLVPLSIDESIVKKFEGQVVSREVLDSILDTYNSNVRISIKTFLIVCCDCKVYKKQTMFDTPFGTITLNVRSFADYMEKELKYKSEKDPVTKDRTFIVDDIKNCLLLWYTQELKKL